MAAMDMGKSWEAGEAAPEEAAEAAERRGSPGSGGTDPFQVEAEGRAEEVAGADAR